MYVLCKIIFVLSSLVFPTALIGLFCQIQDSAINSAFRTLLCREILSSMLDKGRFIRAAGGESVSSTPKMTIKQNAGEGN